MCALDRSSHVRGSFRSLAIVSVLVASLSVLGRPAAAQDNGGPAPSADAGAPGAAKDAAGAGPAPEVQPATGPWTYLQLPADEEEQERVEAAQESRRLAIRKMLNGGTIKPDEREGFETYYKTYALARWTWRSKHAELANFRRELRSDLKIAKISEANTQLTEIALAFLTEVAGGDYHPAARYNALLAIGELNKRESLRVSEPPVPMPQALPVLLKALDDPRQPDVVKVASLLGILRHVKAGLPEAQIPYTEVLSPVLALAESKMAAGRTAEGHLWMRARAVEVLGAMRAVGEQNVVVRTLAGIVAEEGGPLTLRCAAAQALGNLDYRSAINLDPSGLAVALGQLAADACAAELARTDNAPDERRGLKSCLNAVVIGLTGPPVQTRQGTDHPSKGIAGLATNPAHKPIVDDLLKRVHVLVDLCNTEDLGQEAFLARIGEELAQLREGLKKVPTTAAAPAPASGTPTAEKEGS